MPYIGKTPNFGVRNRFVFTPDAGATSVSGADGDWAWMQNNAFSSEDQAWVSFTYVTAS
jgi:hypothetical protein